MARFMSLLVLLAFAIQAISFAEARSLRSLAAADEVVNAEEDTSEFVEPTDDDLHNVAEEPNEIGINSEIDLNNFQDELLVAVNEERRKAGLGPLCPNDKLTSAAQKHSEDMAHNNFMSHTGSDGSSMSQRVDRESFRWSNLGENVAAGQQDVASVMRAWMNSSGHRRNILGNFKFFGGGMARNSNARYGIYWTQVFGSGSSESCSCLVE